MISIVIPFFNEKENLPKLITELEGVLKTLHHTYEIILVDDGSTDNYDLPIKNEEFENIRIKLIKLRKRFGKGAALSYGVRESRGDIVIFMDGDLQDDPGHLPEFINKINSGYDLVNGNRLSSRKDSVVIRSYSIFFNGFLKRVFNSPFTDINCGFKAIKRQVLDEIVLYGNNFRFLPLAAFYKGFRTAEILVTNRPRVHGVSKFGAGKAFIGLIDTITAYFLYQFSEKPLHFFGVVGATSFFIGFIIAAYLSIARIFFGQLLYQRPILFLAMLLIIVGIQIVMTGIIGELIVYINKKQLKDKSAL